MYVFSLLPNKEGEINSKILHKIMEKISIKKSEVL